jgi:hypothetical protein
VAIAISTARARLGRSRNDDAAVELDELGVDLAQHLGSDTLMLAGP